MDNFEENINKFAKEERQKNIAFLKQIEKFLFKSDLNNRNEIYDSKTKGYNFWLTLHKCENRNCICYNEYVKEILTDLGNQLFTEENNKNSLDQYERLPIIDFI